MDVINTFSCFAWWWSFKKRVIIIVFLGAYDSEDHGCFGCSVRRFFLGKTIFVKKKMTKISSYTSKLFLFFYFFWVFWKYFLGFWVFGNNNKGLKREGVLLFLPVFIFAFFLCPLGLWSRQLKSHWWVSAFVWVFCNDLVVFG